MRIAAQHGGAAERRQLDTGSRWPVADPAAMRNIGGMAEASGRPAAHPRPLQPAPARLVEGGAPLEGIWSGAPRDAGFAGLAGEYARGFLERHLVEKRWQALFLATPQAMISLAIVDAGYLSSGILSVFDRGARRMLIDSNPVLPPLFASVGDEPNEGMRALLSGPRIGARIERSGGRILATARWGNAALDLALDARGAPPAMSAAARLGPGRFNFTQKLVGLAAEGEIRVGNARFLARGEPAGLDFTHGYLARDTSWRWAFASARQGGRLIGFNLSEGFMDAGAGENALWVDGAPCSVGPVRFEFDPSAPLAPWRIRGGDGSVDLTFQPEGYRSQSVNLKVVVSKYVQPFGVFSGYVTTTSGDRLTLDSLPGVTEDHTARW
jgi:hypothetical protein